jgi:hypothetical protein
MLKVKKFTAYYDYTCNARLLFLHKDENRSVTTLAAFTTTKAGCLSNAMENIFTTTRIILR